MPVCPARRHAATDLGYVEAWSSRLPYATGLPATNGRKPRHAISGSFYGNSVGHDGGAPSHASFPCFSARSQGHQGSLQAYNTNSAVHVVCDRRFHPRIERLCNRGDRRLGAHVEYPAAAQTSGRRPTSAIAGGPLPRRGSMRWLAAGPGSRTPTPVALSVRRRAGPCSPGCGPGAAGWWTTSASATPCSDPSIRAYAPG